MTADPGRPLVTVTGGTTYGNEPTRYDVRLRVDPTVDLLYLHRRLAALVDALDRELRAADANEEDR